MPWISVLAPSIPNESLRSRLRVKPGTEPPDVLGLGDTGEAKLLGSGPGPERGRLSSERVVIHARELQVIIRPPGKCGDGKHENYLSVSGGLTLSLERSERKESR